MSTCLCLLGAEVFVRVGGFAPRIHPIEITGGTYRSTDDPKLPYEPVPGRGHFNRYGMRDRVRATAPLPSGNRVVAIGDSILFGGGSPVAKIYTSQLEDGLRRHDPRLADAEVWNLGVPGYDTVNEVTHFERRGLGLKPQLVIVGYCLNDKFTQSSELRELARHPKLREQKKLRALLAKHAMARSELVRLILFRLSPDGPGDGTDGKVGQVRAYQNVERGFTRLEELSFEHGFDVAVVVFPFLEPYSSYAHGKDHAAIRRIGAKYGFPVFDLLPAFRNRFGDEVMGIRVHDHDRLHLNATAHALAAQVTTPFIASLLLRPR